MIEHVRQQLAEKYSNYELVITEVHDYYNIPVHLPPLVTEPSLLTHPQPAFCSNQGENHKNHECFHCAHPVNEWPCHMYEMTSCYCKIYIEYKWQDGIDGYRNTWRSLFGLDPWCSVGRYNPDCT